MTRISLLDRFRRIPAKILMHTDASHYSQPGQVLSLTLISNVHLGQFTFIIGNQHLIELAQGHAAKYKDISKSCGTNSELLGSLSSITKELEKLRTMSEELDSYRTRSIQRCLVRNSVL